MEVVREVRGEAAQVAFGERLAGLIAPGMVLHLEGEIGAGKTTLTRGLLRGLGVEGPVKSPTYTLVEPYDSPAGPVYHFDLYRLSDPEELHFFGAEEYFSKRSICILEWADRVGGALPGPDLVLHAVYRDADSRTLRLRAYSAAGEAVLKALSGEADPSDER